MKKISLSDIRREYGTRVLLEAGLSNNPIEQFKNWFDEIVLEELEPTAMTVATVDVSGMPNIRVVLLKGIVEEQFIFYTHYDSAKGKELLANPQVALNFFWRNSSRQVRVRGKVQKTSEEMSDTYFASRPRSSQLSAVASHQSGVLTSREILADKIIELSNQFGTEQLIPRPKEWGGYAVEPIEIEFWQGRDNRLHDRIRYRKENMQWMVERLAP
jgi:pyridoxamine 5'-phosphate oxidase